MPIQMMEIYKIDVENNDTEWRRHFLTTHTTFYLFRVFEEVWESVTDFVNRMVDVLKEFVDRFTQSVKGLVETIGELFDLDSPMEFPVKKSYPHTYLHYVDNSKFNSRGYPMTIKRPCARSRC